jgi:hypothetical protein
LPQEVLTPGEFVLSYSQMAAGIDRPLNQEEAQMMFPNEYERNNDMIACDDCAAWAGVQ